MGDLESLGHGCTATSTMAHDVIFMIPSLRKIVILDPLILADLAPKHSLSTLEKVKLLSSEALSQVT